MLTSMAAGSSTSAMQHAGDLTIHKGAAGRQGIVQMLTQTHATVVNVDQARREECCLPQWQHDVMAWPLGQPFEHADDLLAALCLLIVGLHPLPAVCDACLSLLPQGLSCMLQVLKGMLRLRPNSCLSTSATVHGIYYLILNAKRFTSPSQPSVLRMHVIKTGSDHCYLQAAMNYHTPKKVHRSLQMVFTRPCPPEWKSALWHLSVITRKLAEVEGKSRAGSASGQSMLSFDGLTNHLRVCRTLVKFVVLQDGCTRMAYGVSRKNGPTSLPTQCYDADKCASCELHCNS